MTDPNLLLIVEDSDEDYLLATTAFEEVGLEAEVEWCRDGESALRFLELDPRGTSRTPADGAHRLPAMVLLDLNLPMTDGRDVLSAIRNNPTTRNIPVIVFSTSDAQQDIDLCYQRGANSYLRKPDDIDTLFANMRRLKEFWFDAALLPGT